MIRFAVPLLAFLILSVAHGSESGAVPKAKFKSAKDVSFDSQVVEGQIYRPDLSVVTGDTTLGGFGTLKLRDTFLDRVAIENTGEQK